MSKTTGTRLTDERFFGELLDTTRSGLEGIPAAAAAGDYATCRRLFAAHVRGMLEPERYFSTLEVDMKAADHDEERVRADKALRNIVSSCGFEWDFGEGPVDWFANPTFNGYEEWTWQLSRHHEWRCLARTYRATGDEIYAEACARHVRSWIDQAQAPVPPCSGYDTLCWRTIECGIRMGNCWPEVIHTFYKSPAFTDDLITDWCKSVWEHGERLRRDHRTGNWLIMEMNGLLHVGLLYPCFKLAGEWLDYALKKLEEELFIQVYPDGFQFELTTEYQYVVIANYSRVLRSLRAYGRNASPEIVKCIENLMLTYVRLMQPGGRVPDINDGRAYDAGDFLSGYIDMCPDNPQLRWAVSHRKEGTPPAECNQVFENCGLAALRTGWGAEDTWLFFDGGEFGAGHQHEDKLQVLFYADGDYTLTEADRYAYDSSETRKYCLSTRGHNTIRVDGMDQNRRKTYQWDGNIERKTDMQWHFTPTVDSLRAVYNEGYGEDQDKSVTHERSVYFVKQAEGLKPFAVVVDRLTADRVHDYEVLWHLDAPKASMDGLCVRANTLNLLVPDVSMETAGVSLCRGQQFPQWQGWKCNSTVQKDFRPIYTAQYDVHAQDVRWVTVLYPDGGQPSPLAGVEASLDVKDTKITLRRTDGTAVELDEAALW